ncbi:MAG: TetR/AcrR family transcriptional regulator [Actinobacteria bacterium]|nr:MAG: TetR/AcrR family transcriptional regulator [Actinomycetota bacterium]
MMSSTRNERKDRSRERIIESAGSLVRGKGISGASVAGVMEGAGMTVGGFYAHFPSKQALVVEALRHTLRKSRALLAAPAGDMKGADWLRAVARSYLSRSHRDHPESGCPLPANLGEIARGSPAVRRVLAGEIGDMRDELASHLVEDGLEEADSEALAMLATMVGGLTLSRALRGSDLSDQVLQACRRHIERSLSNH